MEKSLKNYTIKHLTITLLIVIAVWEVLFYALILDEVYDNVDDGLKNQKINILRAVYADSTLLDTKEFGVNQFIIIAADSISTKNVFSKEMTYMEYDDEMEPYRILRTGFYARNGKPYHLEIRTSTVEEDDFLINLTIALIALYILLIISIYFTNSIVLGRALKPLKSFVKTIQEYRFDGKTTIEPLQSKVKEFNTLEEKFTEMVKRNESIYHQQKLFLENASHELQTPLAITINKLELLLEDPGLGEKQLQEISETKRALHRMVSLNKSLLMLSKIENRQYLPQDNTNINKIITELTAEFTEIFDFKKLKLDFSETGQLYVRANHDLMVILFSNLLRNAIKYNYEGGKVTIDINPAQIRVSNTSLQPALDTTIAFKRFYKFTQDSTSTGLGLSIVESIVNTTPDISIEYQFLEKQHTFLVRKA